MNENERTELDPEEELRQLREFHAEIEEYERNNPLDSKQQQAIDAEDVRLPERFPGEFVAYQDHWDGTTFTRTILAHAPDPRTLRNLLAVYTDEQLQDLITTYVDPPNTALCTRLWTNPPRPRNDTPQE